MHKPFLIFGYNPNTILIIILVAIVIFFLLREVICWYYKINDMVELLKSIDRKLDKLNYIDISKSQPMPELQNQETDRVNLKDETNPMDTPANRSILEILNKKRQK